MKPISALYGLVIVAFSCTPGESGRAKISTGQQHRRRNDNQANGKGTDSAACTFIDSNAGQNRTVTFMAIYITVGEIASTETLELLEKDKLLRAENFTYALNFKVPGCFDEFYMPCQDSIMADKLYPLKAGRKIRITCAFFEKYPVEDSKPFFIVKKVEIL